MQSASGTDTFNKSKWTWRSPSVDKTALSNFAESQNAWSNNHMYRTSYHDMSDKVSLKSRINLQITLHKKKWMTFCRYFFIQNKYLTLFIAETCATQVLCHPKIRWIHPRKEWQLRAWKILHQDHP